MFRGTYEQKIDDKGRVNVPVKFREFLRGGEDERLFITNSRLQKVPCLDVYPYSAWQRLEERLRGRSADLPPEQVVFYINYYLPGVQECPIDKQGRILVPPRLRDYAGLVKDVVFTGQLDMFRIWDRDAWQPVFSSGEQVLMANPGIVPGFGI